MPKIYFVNENKRVSVNAGSNIRAVALNAGISLYSGAAKVFNCHGMGFCGECVIEVETTDSLSPKKQGEIKKLAQKNRVSDQARLACQCQVFGRGEIVVKTKPSPK